MDTGYYVSKITRFDLNERFVCSACGAETPSSGRLCICSNCEYLTATSGAELQKRDPALFDSVRKIYKYTTERRKEGPDYDSAIAEYQKLGELDQLNIIYGLANTYAKYSNYEISKISYARQGFMEENALHRERAAKMLSGAKRQHARIVSLVGAQAVENSASQSAVYALFQSQLRLNKLRGAEESAKRLANISSKYLGDYASVVFEVNAKRYAEAVSDCEKLIQSQDYSVNLFYYLAFALFKTAKPDRALDILVPLKGVVKSSSVEQLIFEIERAGSI